MNSWKDEFIHTSRGVFEVFIKGEGKPVCVTHHYSEFNQSGDYFADSFTEDHQVILVNLREAGNSAKAEEGYQLSMIEAVFDLEAVRETLGFTKWTFAGHSTGGMIGVLYGIHFSNSLNELIIVGATAREYASSKECIYNHAHSSFGYMQSLIEKLKLPTLSDTEREEVSKLRTKLSLYKPELYDMYFNQSISKRMSSKRMNFFNREALIFDVTRQLNRISTKTLIICGRHDVQCPVSFSIEMASLIPFSELHIFENSNHYPFLEEKLLFNSVVRNFIQSLNVRTK